MTFPTKGSCSLMLFPRSSRSFRRRGELHTGVGADLVGGEVNLADRLSLADANHDDITTVHRRITIAAQHVAFPRLRHALVATSGDRDQRVGALDLVLDHATGHRRRGRVVAVRVRGIRVVDVDAPVSYTHLTLP